MTEQDSTKLLFLFEQYRPEPHAVKASDTEMTNLSFDNHSTSMLLFLFLKQIEWCSQICKPDLDSLFHTEPSLHSKSTMTPKAAIMSFFTDYVEIDSRRIYTRG